MRRIVSTRHGKTQFESIAEAADFLALKITAYWKDSDDYFFQGKTTPGKS